MFLCLAERGGRLKRGVTWTDCEAGPLKLSPELR